jgi:ribulose-phosphate 3-epimerase
MSSIVSPSILSADFLNLGKDIEKFNQFDDIWMHLDVMDSHFVPNLTFGKPVVKNIKDISNHKLDAHLMVNNPEFFIENFKDIGLHNFTFHYEADVDHIALAKKAKKYYPSVGLSINPPTNIEDVPKLLFKEFDLILLMSVNPGFSGQKFIPSVYDKITYVKDLGLDHEIQVDGGVDGTNASRLRELGATNLVSGSYLFKSANLEEAIKSLR